MFKGKLINSQAYYKWRSLAFGITLFPPVIWILVVYKVSWLWGALILLIALAFALFQRRVTQQVAALSKGKRIEISGDAIRVLRDSGEVIEELKVADASQILIKDTYAMPGETVGGLVNEIKGKTEQNYIVYRSPQKKVRYDFIVDSYYMIEQLKKAIQEWHSKGVEIGMIRERK